MEKPQLKSSAQTSKGQNRRPKEVTALLLEPALHPAWFLANKLHNRFFIVNLEYVMTVLNIEYTLTRPYFQTATEVIRNETEWPKAYPFPYTSSHTQLRPSTRNEPKQFDRAAVIIVAMEMAAQEKAASFNVYDWLRILPAHYFIDRFESERLEALRRHYAKMSHDDRIQKFGVASETEPFDNLFLQSIGQRFSAGLLDQVAEGFCVTKFAAEQIVNFVNANFSSDLHVGPVLTSGEDSVSRNLGTRRAAPSLRVPKSLEQDRLGVCQ